MIISDNQNCGVGMATCTESNSIPTLEPNVWSETMYSSSPEIPTFVAMLNDAYEINLADTATEEVTDRMEHEIAPETHTIIKNHTDDEDSHMEVCSIPVKLERTAMSDSYQLNQVSHEYYQYSGRKRGDVLLSEQKPLPDINFFIKTPKRNTVFTTDRRLSDCVTDSITYRNTAPSGYGRNDEEDGPMVFTDISTRGSTENRTSVERLKDGSVATVFDMSSNQYQLGISDEHKLRQPFHSVKLEKNDEKVFNSVTASHNFLRPSVDCSDRENHLINEDIHNPTSGYLHGRPNNLNIFVSHHTAIPSSAPTHLSVPALEIHDFKSNPNFSHPDLSSSYLSSSPSSLSISSPDGHVSPQNASLSQNGFAAMTQNGKTLLLPEGTDFERHRCSSNESFSSTEYEHYAVPCMEEILNEVIRNVEVACIHLQLPPDPKLWTEEQVQNWVNWTINQYKLPSLNSTRLPVTGRQLCELSEAEIRTFAPKCGDFLHAHLEIWRTVVDSNNKIASEGHNESPTTTNHLATNIQKSENVSDDAGNDLSMYFPEKSILDSQESRKALQELRKVEDAIAVMTPNHTAGIHLWQFLKELLLQPLLYGQYIRWIDKENGVFKIEDSVEVARLWGIRKNRPAMNYDKLSRSIRQYYKKGIIKKTEVSQRLVYQFVKPVI